MTHLDIARGSAWIVVALYVATLILDIRRAPPARTKLIWSLGAVTLAAHVSWTMLVVHHGRIDEAYSHTASQTKELIGVPIGAGVYVNFVMLAIWFGDAIAWCLFPSWDDTRRKYKSAMYLVFGFLFFNAAIVFASFWGRLFGLSACVMLAGAWLTRSRQTPTDELQTN